LSTCHGCCAGKWYAQQPVTHGRLLSVYLWSLRYVRFQNVPFKKIDFYIIRFKKYLFIKILLRFLIRNFLNAFLNDMFYVTRWKWKRTHPFVLATGFFFSWFLTSLIVIIKSIFILLWHKIITNLLDPHPLFTWNYKNTL